MTEEARQELFARIAGAARDLGEHLDAVQILGTITDEEGSHRFYLGNGNWFARKGMAHHFITMDESSVSARCIAEQIKEDRE